MDLTVCGSSGTHASPGRACSSYLVEHDGYRLLLDCGNGSLSNLLSVCGAADVDTVLLTHLHPDHIVDVYGLYYALRFDSGGPRTVGLVGPAGTTEFLTRLLPADSAAMFDQTLPLRTARAGEVLELGPLTVRLYPAFHPVETLAPRITAGDRVLAYSGDSGQTDALIDCAAGADLFVCDASWLERNGPHPEGIHMTGAQAGTTAAAAGAARLLVTHVFPANDPDQVAAEAAGLFEGDVLVADDRDRIRV